MSRLPATVSLTSRLVRRRLAGRVGVALLFVATMSLLTGRVSSLPPTVASLIALSGWVGLGLIVWASICPECGGAIALSTGDCGGCREGRPFPSKRSHVSWSNLPTVARVLVWVCGAVLGIVAFLSLAGVD